MDKMQPTDRTAGTMIGERRKARRVHLLTRVDILVAGDGQVYWGSMSNLSWTGVHAGPSRNWSRL